MEKVEIGSAIDIPRDVIAAFCEKHGITWLAVFGSILRDDFTADSDIDVLVEFGPDRTPSLFGHIHIEEDLSRILGNRRIDMGTKRSLNRWVKDRVLNEARVIYDAA